MTGIGFVDRVQGEVIQHLESDVGDFVLRRADGPFAYQLAVAVDDEFQGISDIVRGADLLDSTPRQIWLQRCLGYATPRYAHLPVATNAAGEKLSKQTRAPALDVRQAGATLADALRFLGQPVAGRAGGRAVVRNLGVGARPLVARRSAAAGFYSFAASAVRPGSSSSACQCFGP